MSDVKPLVGRQTELALLQRAIDEIEDEGVALVVRGEPGVGKSSILRAAAAMARDRGASVLECSGVASEAMLPFAGLHQLLQPLLPQVELLPAGQRHALSTAFGGESGPAPELFLTALAALTLVVDTARARPVVLVVDDVQWLDAPTVEVLAFVSRRLRHDPVVMVAALRSGHTVAFGGLDATEMDLRGLSADASQSLLTSVTDSLSPADRRTVLQQAQGNPLALVELPTAWRSARTDVLAWTSAAIPLTRKLEQAFAARIHDLPTRTRDALLIAAVNGRESLAEALAGAVVLAGARVTTEDLEPAAEARLVDFDEVDIRFRHPLVRSGVLYAEPQHRRRAAHAAMSDVLAGEPYRQVWHQAQSAAGTDDEVAARLDASHVESMRRGSVLSAIAALERSAQLTSVASVRSRRLLLAAQHAFGLGRGDLVHRLVDTAAADDLCEADRARAEWLRELFSEGELGDAVRIRELCSLAARSVTSDEVDLALDLLASAALRCWWAVADGGARHEVVRTAQNLTAMQDDARCVAVIAVADPLGQAAPTRRRLETINAAGVSDPDQLRQLGMAARAVGADPLAADYFAAAEATLRSRGQLGLLSQVLAVQAAVYVDLGNWSRAGQNLEEGRRLSEETGQSTWRAGTAAVEAVYEGVTGDTVRARRHAAEIEAACAGGVAGDFRSLAQLARGAAHLSDGRHAEALAALLPVFDPQGSCHHPREQLSGVMLLAEAAAGCGAQGAVRDVFARLEVVAAETTSPILAVHLLYARPVLAADDDAEDLFRSAIAEDLTRWPWPRARIELAYGMWMRRRRRFVDARPALRSALTTFDAIGATGWSRQTRAALRACGDRDITTRASNPRPAMTAQETQIARLAAEGFSNREIGQQLYLSPRTVGSHLYRIFPKLGVTSRAQLADRLAPS